MSVPKHRLDESGSGVKVGGGPLKKEAYYRKLSFPTAPQSLRRKNVGNLLVYSVFEQIVENFHGLSFCYSYSPPDIPDPKMLLETHIWS